MYCFCDFLLPFINVAIMGWMYEIVEESFMGRVQSLLSPLTTGFQLLSLGAIAMLFPKWIRADTLYIILFGLLLLLHVYIKLFYLVGKSEYMLSLKKCDIFSFLFLNLLSNGKGNRYVDANG